MSNPIRTKLIFTELRDEIEISSFQCESEELNEFLHETAKFNEKNLISKVYLYYNKSTKIVVVFIIINLFMSGRPTPYIMITIYFIIDTKLMESSNDLS
ncbi:MAG: hypothetical protein ACTSRI_00635 [Promethearchaeota archaeon]